MILIEDTDQSVHNSHLFMMRLWLEELGNGRIDWRGKVQHVSSGEVRYFREWSTLETFVEGLLQLEQEREIKKGETLE